MLKPLSQAGWIIDKFAHTRWQSYEWSEQCQGKNSVGQRGEGEFSPPAEASVSVGTQIHLERKLN